MSAVKFVDLSKNKAFRRAIDFWYKNLKDEKTLKDFLLLCSLEKIGIEYIVSYWGNKK